MDMTFFRAALLGACVLLSGCDSATTPATPAATATVLDGKTMGTFWRVSVIGVDEAKAQALRAKVQAQLDADDRLLSTWKNDSALMRFNHAATTEPWPVSEAMADIVTLSLRIGAKTHGAMDITVGPLVNLWGFGPDKQPVTTPDAGPSEVLVLADGRSNPAWVAADLLSQAEHDRMAAAVLVTDSRPLAEAVAHELERQLAALPRAEIARASLEANGKLIVCRDLREGIAVANRIAPEHLELCVDNPFDYLGEIQNAGSVFLGRYNPEPMGDYFAGPNHTLPTMGTARFYSPLSVDDFVKKSQFSYYTRDALARDYRKVSLFARKEGLDAHARAVDIRFEGGEA